DLVGRREAGDMFRFVRRIRDRDGQFAAAPSPALDGGPLLVPRLGHLQRVQRGGGPHLRGVELDRTFGWRVEREVLLPALEQDRVEPLRRAAVGGGREI